MKRNLPNVSFQVSFKSVNPPNIFYLYFSSFLPAPRWAELGRVTWGPISPDHLRIANPNGPA